jgi:hypothetical protein
MFYDLRVFELGDEENEIAIFNFSQKPNGDVFVDMHGLTNVVFKYNNLLDIWMLEEIDS